MGFSGATALLVAYNAGIDRYSGNRCIKHSIIQFFGCGLIQLFPIYLWVGIPGSKSVRLQPNRPGKVALIFDSELEWAAGRLLFQVLREHNNHGICNEFYFAVNEYMAMPPEYIGVMGGLAFRYCLYGYGSCIASQDRNWKSGIYGVIDWFLNGNYSCNQIPVFPEGICWRCCLWTNSLR